MSHPAKDLPSLSAGGVMGALWRILGDREDDEDDATRFVHPPKPTARTG